MSQVFTYDMLIGKVVSRIERLVQSDEVHFYLDSGEVLRMWHYQACCEEVVLESVDTELSEVEGTIKRFEETTLEVSSDEQWTSATFYNITIGSTMFNMRWYGSSNGYYSESVDLNLYSKEEWNDHENNIRVNGVTLYGKETI
jgi:hypothetical protein